MRLQDSVSPLSLRRKVIGAVGWPWAGGNTTRTQFSRAVAVVSRLPWSVPLQGPKISGGSGASAGTGQSAGPLRRVRSPREVRRGVAGFFTAGHTRGRGSDRRLHAALRRSSAASGTINTPGWCVGQLITAFQTALQHRSDDAKFGADPPPTADGVVNY